MAEHRRNGSLTLRKSAKSFVSTDEKNVWEISELNLPYDPDAEKEEDKGKPVYEFKVADANWGAVNLGAGEAEIVPGTPYVDG